MVQIIRLFNVCEALKDHYLLRQEIFTINISNTFLFFFSNQMLVNYWVRIHKLFVRIANKEDPDQTAS